MKKLLLLLALAAFGASASERVNMTCEFDALAAGYTSKSYSVNLILADGYLYNQDGSTGRFQGKSIYAGSQDDPWFYGRHYYGIHLSDGSSYRLLNPPSSGWSYAGEWSTMRWSLNAGTISCTLTKGWTQEYYTVDIGGGVSKTHAGGKAPGDDRSAAIIHDTIPYPVYVFTNDSIIVGVGLDKKTGLRCPGSVLHTIGTYADDLYHIYREYLKRSRNTDGGAVIKLAVSVSQSGDVVYATVGNPSSGNQELDNKITDKVCHMKFNPVVGGNADMTLLLFFTPTDKGETR